MRFRPKSGLLAVAVAGLAVAALLPLPALADGPLNLELQLGGRCLTGHRPVDALIRVKLLRSDGTVLETRRDASASFEWSVCFVHHKPVAGNRIRLINGAMDRTARVPDLTIAPDRVTNVVRGHAPAGTTVQLSYAACDSEGICTKKPPTTVTADGHGRFRKDLSSTIDIDGSDQVRVIYANSHEDRFIRFGRAPHMEITRPDRFVLSCLPLGTTTLRLLSATGALRAIKSFHTQRACTTVSGRFRKDGHAVNLHAGDRIKSDFASDATMVWPSASVSASGYTYSLRCFPNADWHLTIVDGGGVTSYSGTTDADGRFSILGYQLIAPGASLRVTCESPRGDRVIATGMAS
jgi:hypothetical protein